MSLNTAGFVSRSTPLTEDMSRAILNDSLTRETAYLDGLNDALAVLDDTYTDLNDKELRREPVVRAFLRERLGCFAAGVCAGLIGATVLAGVAAVGLVPLSLLQLILLTGGLIAIYFFRDPFHVNQDALAYEADVRRRLLEMRREKMEYRVADGRARATTVSAALGQTGSAISNPVSAPVVEPVVGAVETDVVPSDRVPAPGPLATKTADGSEETRVETSEPSVKRRRKISRMKVPRPAVVVGASNDDAGKPRLESTTDPREGSDRMKPVQVGMSDLIATKG